MTSLLHKFTVKSWLGLGIGILGTGLNILSFVESRELHSIFGALGFLFFTYPWCQLTSFKKPLPMTPATVVMTSIGLAFLVISLLLRIII